MADLLVTVVKKTLEADRIYSFELAAADGWPLPGFSAGAHIDVHVREGVIRQYSLCGDPADPSLYQIAVLRDAASRGGSIAMHDELREGDCVTISAPRNHFPLVPATRTLLLAGGIGVTPMLCMAEELAANGADFALHYCARSPQRAAFRERLAGQRFAGRAHFHYDEEAAGRRLDMAALLANPGAGQHLYVCGPAGFIDHVLATARDCGWPDAQLHREYFAAQAIDTSHDGGFEVRIASSGVVLEVPADVSVASVLARHGISIAMSCEQGVCGTCVTGILDGVPEHRDLCLSDEERARNDQFTPCCSRSKSRLLVLDL